MLEIRCLVVITDFCPSMLLLNMLFHVIPVPHYTISTPRASERRFFPLGMVESLPHDLVRHFSSTGQFRLRI